MQRALPAKSAHARGLLSSRDLDSTLVLVRVHAQLILALVHECSTQSVNSRVRYKNACYACIKVTKFKVN